jgi:hypothetical protein
MDRLDHDFRFRLFACQDFCVLCFRFALAEFQWYRRMDKKSIDQLPILPQDGSMSDEVVAARQIIKGASRENRIVPALGWNIIGDCLLASQTPGAYATSSKHLVQSPKAETLVGIVLWRDHPLL